MLEGTNRIGAAAPSTKLGVGQDRPQPAIADMPGTPSAYASELAELLSARHRDREALDGHLGRAREAVEKARQAAKQQDTDLEQALAAVLNAARPVFRGSLEGSTSSNDPGDSVEEFHEVKEQALRVINQARGMWFKGTQRRLVAYRITDMRVIHDNLSRQASERVTRLEGELKGLEEQRRRLLQRQESEFSGFKDRLAAAEPSFPVEIAGWESPQWQGWTPRQDIGRVLRLGTVVGDGSIRVPATVAFPGSSSVVVTHDGRRDEAVALTQSLLLRTVTSFPPAACDFTFIDPAGLGEAVAPFLHLKDYDESLVRGRALTQPQHIQAGLDEIVVHIETVVQQYLRSRFESLDDYNDEAGEVAERYRVVVLLDALNALEERHWPTLTSIIQHGPRSGVFVIACDDQRLVALAPPNAIRAYLGSTGITFTGGPEAPDLVVQSDAPPALTFNAGEGDPENLFTRLVTGVGTASRGASVQSVTLDRVLALTERSADRPEATTLPVVSRPVVADRPDTWWGADATDRLSAPAGRAGARDVLAVSFDSRKLASALVVGAPGMGKTTLLHATILSLALHYSPEELELYLLDSKQGVEFKVYETLPHAKAVAIRNEREFGVSVLQGLRDELDRRAALIKGATSGGEVDLPGYRRHTGKRLPRILMVADEFHELFEQVDRLGQEAAALLDDLIRQGRSYGIHVLLGSQTLSGVEALPRHTLQLVQGRIAFACREQDAELVMSEDNREVRTLSRIGDGIWNPERGTPDANVRFQGLFIPAADRVKLVKQLTDHARETGLGGAPVVFDGDEAFPLDDFRIEAFTADSEKVVHVRVGEPCALSGPVWTRMPRRPGANLLTVADDRTTGALLHCVLAASRGLGPRGRIHVIDLLGEPDPLLDVFAADDTVTVSRRRALGDVFAEITAEIDARVSLDDYTQPPVLLVLRAIKGLRDPDAELHDGRSFNDLLEAIVENGPEVGIHTLVLADTAAAVDRRLSHRAIREFGLVVAGRMSESDSERLIGTGDASQLRAHQALMWDDAESSLHRLRCYDAAGPDWFSSSTPD